MYRYARTKNRVHRVVIEGGRAFKVENCNLDDVGFLNLVDAIPEGTRCAWCWAGYVEPTPEQKAAESAENAKREEQVKEEIPPNAKPIPLVTSTRRMAAAVIAGALLLGAATGVLASPDQAKPTDSTDTDALVVLRQRIDDLFVQVRILSVDINSHTHEPSGTAAPVIVVLPTFPPAAPTFTPVVIPTSDPGPVVTPGPSDALGAPDGRTGGDTTTNRTTIIVIPGDAPVGPAPQTAPTAPPVPVVTPAPTPPPTPAPAPTCFRPGIAGGVLDRCKWPPDN